MLLALLVLCVPWAGWDSADAKSIRRVPSEFVTIQAGIDAADPGDEVLVAGGRYSGPGNKNLDLRQKDITVRSESGADLTVIDCEGTGRGFILYGALTPSAIIEGFTIENGSGSGEAVGGGGMVIGGGSPTIRRCVFRKNSAQSKNFSGGGGGLACHGSTSLVEECDFIQNSVIGTPGAVGGGFASHEAKPQILGCRFIGNEAISNGGGGGGMYVHLIAPTPEVIIDNCEFIGNHGEVGGGGAVSGARITNSSFESNVADESAGMTMVTGCEMVACVAIGNVAETFGGGVTVGSFSRMTDCVIKGNTAEWGAGVWAPSGTIEGCVISDNVAKEGAGGILCNGRTPVTITRCTLARNSGNIGSGIIFTQPLNNVVNYVDNTIVSSGRGGNAISCFGFATVVLSCTNLFGNEGGDWTGCVADQVGVGGNFSADPRFCAEGKDDFTLAANSPCLPGNHPQGGNCGLIGAEEEGCPAIAVETTTWGRIKARPSPTNGQ